jgi:hypothetical protein
VRAAIALALSPAFTLNAALAFPDGAPWGAANPAAEQHCATCHFESEPIRDSSALVVDGLPARPTPGAIYNLEIVFDGPAIVTAGFQLIADAEAKEAGTFTSTEPDIEFVGAAVRSTAAAKDDDGVSWSIEWRAPGEIASTITFYVAASAANDDGSPFGDTIHYRSYRLLAE